MHPKITTRLLLLFLLLASIFPPASSARASLPLEQHPALQDGEVTAYDLIIAMNSLRMSNGLPALIEDGIINAVAQSTAEYMAANQMSWHIGNVSGRLQSAGYGGGSKVWATENFAVGGHHTIDVIMQVWADPDHMIPAVNPAYCHVGAGVAKGSNGMTYYVLQAAYTSGKSCGPYVSPGGGGTTTPGARPSTISQVIVPVKVATPDADGKVYHVVQAGQSLWAIAVAYKITIKDLEVWNNINKDTKLQVGQKLFIPGENTEGYATPTPVGMIQISTPEADGKIIHTVQTYQTLSTISQAYKVEIDTILQLNGIQVDWPLQVGQKLVIHGSNVTPSATPRPLTPIEKLTPASDGKYYHVVQSGETLSWIADLYKIKVLDLMTWNGLNNSSIIQPSQKLLLQVTPPATVTFTPGPPTATATITETPQPTPTASASPTPSTSQTSTVVAGAGTSAEASMTPVFWIALIGLLTGGSMLVVLFARRRR